LLGLKGFARTVAIKQLHPQFARDPEFVSMFLDEARLAARIHHPNVVAPLDVVALDDEIFIVMEYVHGEALFRLMRLSGSDPLPPAIASSVMIQVLLGLHAAHEAADERGQALAIVHRDVSPQNILVGEDGVARIVDFGIAKAARRVHSTGDRKLKGKLGYMAPEQLRLEETDRRADVFSAGVVLWEMLTGSRLFPYDEPAKVVAEMLEFRPQPIGQVAPAASAFDSLLLRALQPEPEERFQSSREMAMALEAVCAPAGVLEVAAWVARTAGSALRQRAAWVADAENQTPGNLTLAKGLPRAASTPLADGSGRPLSFIDSTQPFALDASAGSAGSRSSEASRPSVSAAPRRKRPALWVALASAGALLTLAGVALLRGPLSGDEPASVVVLPATAPDPAPTRDDQRGSESAAPPGRASAGDAAAKADAAVPARASSPRRANAAPKSERKPSRRADCAVPYTVDAKGIKRFRSECF
ncbi:MAG TPA: serine/threonine-protein kinase, partial [Polyangiaceae bacterium]|nr:serine/threonine-protein kinase [Polyangiaceae bacterium]